MAPKFWFFRNFFWGPDNLFQNFFGKKNFKSEVQIYIYFIHNFFIIKFYYKGLDNLFQNLFGLKNILGGLDNLYDKVNMFLKIKIIVIKYYRIKLINWLINLLIFDNLII